MTVRLTITPGPGADLITAILEERIGDKVNTAGLEGEAVAKQLAPVDTGNLRNGIAFTMTDTTAGELTSSAEYAAYVEFGTRRMDARPHMIPGLEAAKAMLSRLLRQP